MPYSQHFLLFKLENLFKSVRLCRRNEWFYGKPHCFAKSLLAIYFRNFTAMDTAEQETFTPRKRSNFSCEDDVIHLRQI